MRPSQDQIFFASEGDKWFERNRQALEGFDPERDIPLRLMALHDLRPRNVLEVGAANGVRLAAINEKHSSRVVAVEPSVEAIAHGKARFPCVEFVRGTADAIPLQELFDLIIASYVFHWIDRSSLLRAVAEIDRLLGDGGFLIIADFCPSNLTKVRYHHLLGEEVYTYKQNYAAPFLGSGMYQPICLLTGDHTTKTIKADVAEHERIGGWLLRKMLRGHYVEIPFHP